MTIIVACHFDASRLPKTAPGTIPVQLYAHSAPKRGIGVIGGGVLDEVRRLGVAVPQNAFDFLSVALAVTAADTFVQRGLAADAWTRDIRLIVPVANPGRWTKARPLLERAMRFLSGDLWTLEIVDDGRSSPMPQTRGNIISLRPSDCVSLFSGGLDSTIGALDLLQQGRRPLLVSHAYTSDQSRQIEIHAGLPLALGHFAANAHPNRIGLHDVSMRTRSLNFIAFGAVVAAVLAMKGVTAPVPLVMPENGVISLNPPLTPRRIGSLSTRTTHPYFIGLVQQVLDLLAIPTTITNPYQFKTKGEMIAECRDAAYLAAVAPRTVSCGKWKRKSKQCGRCVPCLIRRAGFHAAGLADATLYRFRKLNIALAREKERDDILAVMLAIYRSRTVDIGKWVAQSGPLPVDQKIRTAHIDVFTRGVAEMEAYLKSLALLR